MVETSTAAEEDTPLPEEAIQQQHRRHTLAWSGMQEASQALGQEYEYKVPAAAHGKEFCIC